MRHPVRTGIFVGGERLVFPNGEVDGEENREGYDDCVFVTSALVGANERVLVFGLYLVFPRDHSCIEVNSDAEVDQRCKSHPQPKE